MERWNNGRMGRVEKCKVCKVQPLLLTFNFLLSTFHYYPEEP
jgi:hypothetical protein